jgi:hypothetical protein
LFSDQLRSEGWQETQRFTLDANEMQQALVIPLGCGTFNVIWKWTPEKVGEEVSVISALSGKAVISGVRVDGRWHYYLQ